MISLLSGKRWCIIARLEKSRDCLSPTVSICISLASANCSRSSAIWYFRVNHLALSKVAQELPIKFPPYSLTSSSYTLIPSQVPACHLEATCMPPGRSSLQLLFLLKLMSIGSVMPSSHLIFCHPLLLLPSIFPSIRVFFFFFFFNESALHIRWPKYWSFSFSISPPNEYSVLISFRID